MHCMSTARAELSSLSTLLGDLTDRVTALAERARAQEDAELSTELFTVERDLRAALRRLGRATRTRRPTRT